MNAKSAVIQLLQANALFVDEPLRTLNMTVLLDTRFAEAPGGLKRHHNYRGGLAIHTAEVLNNAIALASEIDLEELVTAVIWHDYMKIREYALELSLEGFDKPEKVVSLPYRERICHLPGSAMEFHRLAYGKIPEEQLERIEHLLLSHHGRKEWRSPVTPQTAEAHILHTADVMSAEGVNL